MSISFFKTLYLLRKPRKDFRRKKNKSTFSKVKNSPGVPKNQAKTLPSHGFSQLRSQQTKRSGPTSAPVGQTAQKRLERLLTFGLRSSFGLREATVLWKKAKFWMVVFNVFGIFGWFSMFSMVSNGL